MLVVLIDWSVGGHNATHIIQFAQAIAKCGATTAVLCLPGLAEQILPSVADGTVGLTLQLHTIQYPGFIPVRPRSLQMSLRKRELQKRVTNAILSAERTAGKRASLVFFSCLWEEDADIYLRIVNSIDRHFSGLYLHPRHFCESLTGSDRTFPKLRKFLTHKRVKFLATMNENMAKPIADSCGKIVYIFPEISDLRYIPDHAFKQRLRRFSGRSPLVVLAGYLGPWKGVSTLCEAAMLREAQSTTFAILGTLPLEAYPSSQRSLIQTCMNEAGNVLFHCASLPDGPCYNAAIDAADVVFAAFENFPFSSNTLTKTACFKKPAIVSDGGLMAERVRRYRIGKIVPQLDSTAVMNAITELTTNRSDWELAHTPDWLGACDAHSQTRLVAQWKELLNLC